MLILRGVLLISTSNNRRRDQTVGRRLRSGVPDLLPLLLLPLSVLITGVIYAVLADALVTVEDREPNEQLPHVNRLVAHQQRAVEQHGVVVTKQRVVDALVFSISVSSCPTSSSSSSS